MLCFLKELSFSTFSFHMLHKNTENFNNSFTLININLTSNTKYVSPFKILLDKKLKWVKIHVTT